MHDSYRSRRPPAIQQAHPNQLIQSTSLICLLRSPSPRLSVCLTTTWRSCSCFVFFSATMNHLTSAAASQPDVPTFVYVELENTASSTSSVTPIGSRSVSGMSENEYDNLVYDYGGSFNETKGCSHTRIEEDDVDVRDIQAMKQMVQEIRENPELLYERCSIPYRELFDTSSITVVTASSSSLATQRRISQQSISINSGNITICCQECNSLSAITPPLLLSSSSTAVGGLPLHPFVGDESRRR